MGVWCDCPHEIAVSQMRKGRYETGPSMHLRCQILLVVGSFAVRAEVETLTLVISGRTQADENVNELVENHRSDTAPDDRDHNGDDLDPDLRSDREVVATGAAQPGSGKDARADCADDTADAV